MKFPHVALGVFLEGESCRAVVARKWLLSIMNLHVGVHIRSRRKSFPTFATVIRLFLLVDVDMLI